MNLIPMFAAVGDVLKGGWIIIAIIGIALVFFVGFLVVLSRYTKVGPNQVLVVSGRQHKFRDADGQVFARGFRIVKGGGTFVLPVIEKIERSGSAFAGRATITVSFSEPGEYVLRVVANDYSGEGGGGFQCCWTNIHVKVVVKGP